MESGMPTECLCDPLIISGIVGCQVYTATGDKFMVQYVQERCGDKTTPVMSPFRPGIREEDGAFGDRIRRKTKHKRFKRFAMPQMDIEQTFATGTLRQTLQSRNHKINADEPCMRIRFCPATQRPSFAATDIQNNRSSVGREQAFDDGKDSFNEGRIAVGRRTRDGMHHESGLSEKACKKTFFLLQTVINAFLDIFYSENPEFIRANRGFIFMDGFFQTFFTSLNARVDNGRFL